MSAERPEAFYGVWQALIVGMNQMLESFVIPMTQMNGALAQVAPRRFDGDVERRLSGRLSDDNATTRKHDGETHDRRAACQNRRVGCRAAQPGDERGGWSDVQKGASQQAAATEEVSASMEEMAANIRQTANNAKQTEQIARKSADDARAGPP